MKKIILSSVLLLSGFFIQAQQAPEKISFNSNGEFKIAQFTDMHLGHDQEKDRIVGDMIKEVLDSEKPDLVIFTGDNTTMDEVRQAWEAISAELSARRIPWTAVLGNHDDEYAVKRDEIIRIIREQPYCMMKQVAEGIKGEGNHILPALTFLHIPLPEYTQAWESFETKRYGDRNEKECSPHINSGMFANMLECGDVMGVFAGHDHVNDYIATLYNIALGYGRASGGKNTYGDKTPGSRIIVLKEGKREFDTWLREKGNMAKLNVCTYPGSFVKEK